MGVHPSTLLAVPAAGAEDRALLFEADAGMTLLEAIKDVFLGGGGGGGGGSDGSKPSIAAATSLGRVPTSTTATAKQQQQVVHRLAVFEEHGDITHIVSQLDVVRWLHVQMEAAAAAAAAARTAAAGGGGGGFGGSSQPTAQTHSSAATAGAAAASGGSLCGGAFPAASQQQALSLLGARSLIDLGLLTGKPPVVSVDPNLLTLLAYERMLAAGVSGAAVVHPDTGRLIANLSVSDLRSMRAAHFGCLALPVAEFLAHLHQAVYLGYYYPHQQPGTTSRDDGGSGQHGGGRRNEFFADAAAARRSRQTSSSGMAAAGASHHKVAPGAAVGGAASPALGEGSSSHALRRIVCWPDSSLRHVLSLLADNHVHRVYVCPVSSSGGRQQQQRSANSAAAAWGHRNDGISGGGWQGAAAAADLTSSSLIPQAVITPTDILRLLAGVW